MKLNKIKNKKIIFSCFLFCFTHQRVTNEAIYYLFLVNFYSEEASPSSFPFCSISISEIFPASETSASSSSTDA